MQLESVPRLPARIVTEAILGTGTLRLLWRHEVYGIKEAVTVRVEADTAVIPRAFWDTTRVTLELRLLPRRGGQALLLHCPTCHRPSRHLCAWRRTGNRVIRADWPCRICAGLRYASEGWRNPWSAWLGPRGRSPWDPEVKPQEQVQVQTSPNMARLLLLALSDPPADDDRIEREKAEGESPTSAPLPPQD